MKIRTALLSLLLGASLLLSACGIRPLDGSVVATAGDYKITYDEFRYFFLNTKKELDGGDASVWEGKDAPTEQLKKDLEYRLKRLGAIAKMAKDYDLSIGSEGKEAIESTMSSFRDSMESEEAYLAALEEKFASEYAFEQMLRSQYLFEMVREYVTDERNFLIRADDATLFADIEKNFWRGAQILIRNDEGEDPGANRALAEQVLSELKDGESFFTLMAKYGEDPQLSGNQNSYYFTTGQLLPYFEKEVRALEIGQTSEVVECVHGYAIITRLPMEEEYIKGHLESLRDAMMYRIFNEMLEEEIKALPFKTSPSYYTYTVDNVT